MAEFPRPGVRVSQQFRTTSPTYTRPALPACIVGPCHQVVEGVQDDGTFNPDASITLPAMLAFNWVSSPYEYSLIGTKALVVEISNAAPVSLTFSTGPALTAAVVAAEFNAAGFSGVEALVEVQDSNQRVVLRTTGTGENASIRVNSATHADVLSSFGLKANYTVTGLSGYANYTNVMLGVGSYPDPRDNIDELDIDYDTVRVFVNNGAGVVREASRTSAFLDGATSAVTVQNDGDGDNLSPYLNFANASFVTEAASITGTVDWTGLTYPADFGTDTLVLQLTGGGTVTVTFASPGSAAAAIAAVDTALGANGSAVLDGDGFPVISTDATGSGAYIRVTGGSITHATIGLPVGLYDLGKPGPASAKGTTDITALTYATDVQGRVLRMSTNGAPFQTRVFPSTVTNAASLVADINALWGSGLTSEVYADDTLYMQAKDIIGRESSIRIDTTASTPALLTALGLTTAGGPFENADVVEGPAYAVAVGDEVWVDGVRLGEVTEIVSGVSNRLRISSEQLLTFTGGSWSIIAKGLDNDLPSPTRPGSELYVDPTSGTIYVNAGLFRTSGGEVAEAGPLPLYVAYTALRLDVTAASEDFTQLAFGSTTELEAELSPIDPQNPLGLGMYLAMLNAPQRLVYGLGVDEVTAGAPDGTLDAYARGFTFLESKPVYGIAPLTHDVDVAAVALAHAEAMSDPSISLERYIVWNPSRPTRKASTLVASSQTGNVAGVPTNVASTGVAALQAMLAALGKPGPSYTYSDGIYAEFENDARKYLVASVASGAVTIFAGPFTSGQNTDGFFYDAGGSNVFTTVKVDVPVTIKIRGAALATRDEEAAAYAEIPRAFASRRLVVTAPDQAKMSIDGLEQIVEGYYLNCAVVGMRSGSDPQRPLSNTVVAGFTGLVGSADRYSERQFRIMAGGGLWIFEQDDPSVSAPPRIRHQLTSDMSTVEKREDNIRTALDFAAIFFRSLLVNFTGRYVLTTGITESVSVTMNGGARLLVEQGVFLKCDIQGLRPSESDPTKLEVDAIVRAPYPLNDIDVTLVV